MPTKTCNIDKGS